MDLEEIVRNVSEKMAGSSGIGGSIRIEFKEGGHVAIEDRQVTTSDAEMDCTITMSTQTFEKLSLGNQTPTAAFMMGKLKVSGDMDLALKLGPILTGNT